MKPAAKKNQGNQQLRRKIIGTRSPVIISPNSSSNRLIEKLSKPISTKVLTEAFAAAKVSTRRAKSNQWSSPQAISIKGKEQSPLVKNRSEARLRQKKAQNRQSAYIGSPSPTQSPKARVPSPTESRWTRVLRRPSPKILSPDSRKISPVASPPPPSANRIKKWAYKSKTGSIKGKTKKHNQDSFMIMPQYDDVQGQYMFGVCDGHGYYGHHVSAFLAEKIPEFVARHLPSSSEDLECISDRICLAFQETSMNLKSSSGIDCNFSGSTAWTIIIRGDLIITANVGDSRWVLGQRVGSKWISKDLSQDQKPEESGERERIEAAGGVIEQYSENGTPLGPLRVWVEGEDVPGLAMSRSFGDCVAASIGVIAEPILNFHKIQPGDQFMIIASDGLWEFVNSKRAVEIVGEMLDNGASDEVCNRLTQEATDMWNHYTGVCDDITIVLVVFKTFVN